ncbi:Arc family DNA-binding protein [Wenzhouxiangella sp. XN24]|uniref:Arc family DNA-binding protein n=1 Tax=Wenzhouxiangella sp. XN24 TaxID=2713569 RepID=UPI0013EB6BFC|nr:Arc family DNA-binding protein [Wenzhouxiangella sp. XN24]NGX15615.1 Arc family DNA-binding protein [Wenzhouxiangella sp. XN24]
MAKRDAFLLRIDPEILAAMRRWAEDDLRSLNAQIDYVLRQSLRDAGRMPAPGSKARDRNAGTGGRKSGLD